jgi:hypothetical protein
VQELGIAWMIAAVLMTVVLLVSWKMTKSFFKAWLVMLLFGKVIAAIYYFTGLDRPVLTLEFVNRQNPEVLRTITFSAAQLIFLSFLATLLTSIIVVLYTDLLPRELRGLKRFYEVSESE